MARIGAALLTTGTVLMIIGSLAPWVTTLDVTANSWDLRDLVLALVVFAAGLWQIGVLVSGRRGGLLTKTPKSAT